MSASLVVERSFARLFALERSIKTHRERYEDREDLAGARLLIDALALAVGETQHRVSREWRDAGSDPDPRTVSLLQTMVRGLEFQVGRCLEAIQQEHGREFDPLAEPYLRMARALEPDAELIFRPSETPRYSLSASLLKPLMAGLRGRRSQLVPRLESLPTLVYLRYPVAEEGNVFQHLLIAHEIAHLALRKEVAEDVTVIDEIVAPVFRAWRAEHLAGEPVSEDDDHGYDTQSGEDPHIEQASRRITNWLTELACDLLAMHLVGPAYLLALREHATLRALTYGTESVELESHPHLAWRLELLSRHVDVLMPTSQNDGRRDQMCAVLERFKAGVPVWRGRTPLDLVDAVETGLAAVQERMPLILGGTRFTAEALDAAVDVVWDKLRDGIAPAERVIARTGAEGGSGQWDGSAAWSTPVEWRHIMNVAYFRYFAEQAGDVELSRGIVGWRELEASRDALCDEVRGAVELSELQRLATTLRMRLEVLDAVGEA